MNHFYAIATVWVITWRLVWPLVIVLGLFGLLPAAAVLPAFRQRLPPPWLFPSMFVMPLVGVAWAGFFWAAERSFPTSEVHWQSISHIAISIFSAGIAIGIAVWFRRIRRAWLVFVCAALVVLFSGAAWFVGVMAISDVWL